MSSYTIFMKRYKTVGIFLISVAVFFIIKRLVINISYESDVLNIILTISSLLFGLLAGFFISALWGRYNRIRELQAEWSASILALINYTRLLGTKKFREEFFSFLKKYLYLVVLNDWENVDNEIKYFNKASVLFKQLIIKKKEFDTYLNEFIRTYHTTVEKLSIISILGKEKLSSSEWFMLYILSSMIFFTSIFIKSGNLIFSIFSYLFPFTVILMLLLLNSLSNLQMNIRVINYEPVEICFDALKEPRFYPKKDLKYKPKGIKDYVTEDDIKSELKTLNKELEELGVHNIL